MMLPVQIADGYHVVMRPSLLLSSLLLSSSAGSGMPSSCCFSQVSPSLPPAPPPPRCGSLAAHLLQQSPLAVRCHWFLALPSPSRVQPVPTVLLLPLSLPLSPHHRQ